MLQTVAILAALKAYVVARDAGADPRIAREVAFARHRAFFPVGPDDELKLALVGVISRREGADLSARVASL